MHRSKPARKGHGARPVPLLAPFLAFLLTPVSIPAATPPALQTTPPPGESMGSDGEPDGPQRAFLSGVAAYDSGDHARAVRLWETPAEQGHAGAQFSLGVAFATGNGVPNDLPRAIRWWRAAAEQGHIGAQFNLGMLYSRGEGVERDLDLAKTWWHRAATGGDAAAQFHLGALAATGEGEPQNYAEAAKWWRRSAAQGYEHAVKGLEILRSHGALEND